MDTKRSGAFGVYLDGKEIDKVFFTADHTADEVRRSLIGHDGYDTAIVVRRVGEAPRRRPAPKADRERAKRAGAYADEVYERARSVERMIERGEHFGGYETQGYKQSLVEDTREVLEAAEVATDAFLEVGQERLAKKYIDRAKSYREVYLPAYERRAYTAEGDEGLSYLLRRDVRAIGSEREVPIAPRWQGSIRALTRNARATLLVSPRGSYRYVALDGIIPVSVIQIMSSDGAQGVITNVYTAPEYRRHGWATRLLGIARRRFRVLEHAGNLPPAGAAWMESQRL